ncbi:hypothetical protein HX875_17010 [Pseudomonas yamanorum]|uniref:Alpha/beta hydrolase n=1 Tax=Pseudomonas yamanorum TaxID=515393 RepID=A0A7Y8FEX1_9PSED|nr:MULTISPECIES: hypothetical protein [Pseudomonas]MCS3418142.1 hypothetical protein [Pseudomonas sp. BIGb0558]MCS3437610.1 hypothetical protein [Pseudomonas sp. BIGb0450]NVZ84432.1 hypothetical protein [Pseudomonas yamanorum]NWD25305.1 hypothetical protein [Pseudomonas yamanorum]NWE15462.1 hypothetical protein [Pseudomonas yamanorum]
MKRSKTFATVLVSFALMVGVTSCAKVDIQADASDKRDVDARQVLRLGHDDQAYPFLIYANADLYNPPKSIERAVVIVHGVQRDADQYFKTGRKLMGNAKLPGERTLLLAPNFLTPQDSGVSDDMPLWPRDRWMHGIESQYGHKGIPAFQVLDDVVRYLSDRQRFPALKEIVMVSHSAGAQLMQRYAVVNDLDAGLKAHGLTIRYVIASPSNYLYVDENRLQDGAFAPVVSILCPSYNRYRYGIEAAPAYLQMQHLTGRQLFTRYAARDVTYLVGAQDNNPTSRVLDNSCGANYQGETRLQRQLTYVGYEGFLSNKWQVPLRHPQYTIPGIGHNAARLFGDKDVARILFP